MFGGAPWGSTPYAADPLPLTQVVQGGFITEGGGGFDLAGRKRAAGTFTFSGGGDTGAIGTGSEDRPILFAGGGEFIFKGFQKDKKATGTFLFGGGGVFQLTGVGTQPPSGGGRRKRRPKRLTAAEVRALDRVWLGLPPEAKEVPTPGEYEVVGITEFSIQDTSRASVEYATRNHGSAAFVDDLDASLEVRNGDDAEVLFSSANQPAIDVSPDLEPELVHVASRSAVSTDLWMNRPISKDEALAAIAKAGKRLTKKRQ